MRHGWTVRCHGDAHGALALAVTVLSLGLGCKGPRESAPPGPPVKTYRVRGVVRQVADAESPRKLWIQHEAIPDFVGLDGTSQDMRAMTMQFLLDDTIDGSTIPVGATVAFDLRVDWGASEPALITAIEILPAETPLSLKPPD